MAASLKMEWTLLIFSSDAESLPGQGQPQTGAHACVRAHTCIEHRSGGTNRM